MHNPSSLDNIDLTNLDNSSLDCEINTAIFSFKPFKSPGPDGLHPFFYQKYWNILGNFVRGFCHKVFKENAIPPKINSTYLCLIPKFHNASNLNNFRPISLCSTIYKLIKKIIANRLKPFLDILISPTQSSFFKK